MTPPTIVLLVRHALTPTTGAILPGRAQGLHLSDEGRRQADPGARRFPRGESFTEMQARIVSALARLVERHAGAVLVAVSHADPIKAAVAQALGTPLDLFQRIAIAPSSITAIAYRLEGPLVLTLNSMDGDLAGLVA